MTGTAVALDVLESLDVLLDLATESTFDGVGAIDDVHDAANLVFVELAGLLVGINAGLAEDGHGIDGADAIDVAEADADLFVEGKIDTDDTGHGELLIAAGIT